MDKVAQVAAKSRDLGKALVQLARGVEARFLREPLSMYLNIYVF